MKYINKLPLCREGLTTDKPVALGIPIEFPGGRKTGENPRSKSRDSSEISIFSCFEKGCRKKAHAQLAFVTGYSHMAEPSACSRRDQRSGHLPIAVQIHVELLNHQLRTSVLIDDGHIQSLAVQLESVRNSYLSIATSDHQESWTWNFHVWSVYLGLVGKPS